MQPIGITFVCQNFVLDLKRGNTWNLCEFNTTFGNVGDIISFAVVFATNIWGKTPRNETSTWKFKYNSGSFLPSDLKVQFWLGKVQILQIATGSTRTSLRCRSGRDAKSNLNSTDTNLAPEN